jgi:hypothetical protein
VHEPAKDLTVGVIVGFVLKTLPGGCFYFIFAARCLSLLCGGGKGRTEREETRTVGGEARCLSIAQAEFCHGNQQFSTKHVPISAVP